MKQHSWGLITLTWGKMKLQKFCYMKEIKLRGFNREITTSSFTASLVDTPNTDSHFVIDKTSSCCCFKFCNREGECPWELFCWLGVEVFIHVNCCSQGFVQTKNICYYYYYLWLVCCSHQFSNSECYLCRYPKPVRFLISQLLPSG